MSSSEVPISDFGGCKHGVICFQLVLDINEIGVLGIMFFFLYTFDDNCFDFVSRMSKMSIYKNFLPLLLLYCCVWSVLVGFIFC